MSVGRSRKLNFCNGRNRQRNRREHLGSSSGERRRSYYSSSSPLMSVRPGNSTCVGRSAPQSRQPAPLSVGSRPRDRMRWWMRSHTAGGRSCILELQPGGAAQGCSRRTDLADASERCIQGMHPRDASERCIPESARDASARCIREMHPEDASGRCIREIELGDRAGG